MKSLKDLLQFSSSNNATFICFKKIYTLRTIGFHCYNVPFSWCRDTVPAPNYYKVLLKQTLSSISPPIISIKPHIKCVIKLCFSNLRHHITDLIELFISQQERKKIEKRKTCLYIAIATESHNIYTVDICTHFLFHFFVLYEKFVWYT